MKKINKVFTFGKGKKTYSISLVHILLLCLTLLCGFFLYTPLVAFFVGIWTGFVWFPFYYRSAQFDLLKNKVEEIQVKIDGLSGNIKTSSVSSKVMKKQTYLSIWASTITVGIISAILVPFSSLVFQIWAIAFLGTITILGLLEHRKMSKLFNKADLAASKLKSQK